MSHISRAPGPALILRRETRRAAGVPTPIAPNLRFCGEETA